MFFKQLTKKEHKHLREMGMTTLREFKQSAAKQARVRSFEPDFGEPCFECRAIARKLGLPLTDKTAEAEQ